MHIPLIIAILAFLAFLLLHVLDISTALGLTPPGLRTYWIRIARWAQE